MPYTQISLSLDPYQADLQLQHAVKMASALERANPSSSSKRTRSHYHDHNPSSYSSADSSDESGRFDDAEESPELGYDYESPHSAKRRRRSNDWPLQGNGNGNGDSPRRHGKRGAAHHSPKDRWHRQSRFIEESMSDSISRKPPSIFTGDKGKGGAGGGNGKGRNSGIFRFGKAIAAAFNPFGIWGGSGSGSGSGSGGQDDGRGITKEDAERAYEELKKAGFKGTQKGSYTQQQQQQQQRNSVDSCAADQTWRAVQEKMAGRHSSHDSSGSSQSIATPRRDSGMFRSSWQDLRRAKSTLGIPYSRRHDSQGSSASAVSEGGEVRRQRSKKEMQKQAKLIKKVSNLEEKLGKARKELRELEGDDDEEQQPKTLCLESTYPRKFVPGALPTLPSERLLDRQTLSASPEPLPGSTSYTLFPRVPEKEEEFHDLSANKQRPKTPKKAQSLAPDSSPRKRKSPDPGSKGTDQRDDKIEPSRTPSRKSKFHKTGKADSPTSAALKQTQGQHKTAFQQHRRASPPPKRTSRSSPGTPQLRMRKAQDDLRAAIASKSGQEGLSPSPARGETPTVDGDGVPPVPPIPKDLAAAVPEVKRQGEKSGEEDEFNWPAECF